MPKDRSRLQVLPRTGEQRKVSYFMIHNDIINNTFVASFKRSSRVKTDTGSRGTSFAATQRVPCIDRAVLYQQVFHYTCCTTTVLEQ